MKKIFCIFLSLFIFFVNFNSYKIYTYANAVAVPLPISPNITNFNVVHENVNIMTPTKLKEHSLRSLEELRKETKIVAQEEFNRLDTSAQSNYTSVDDYMAGHYSTLTHMAGKRIKEREMNEKYNQIEKFSRGVSDTLGNIYNGVNSLVKNSIVSLDDINQKIRLQLDTSFVNKTLDYDIDSNPTLKRNLLFNGITNISQDNVSNYAYSHLYALLNSEVSRSSLLYKCLQEVNLANLKQYPVKLIQLNPAACIHNTETHRELKRFFSAISNFTIKEERVSYLSSKGFENSASWYITQEMTSSSIGGYYTVLGILNFKSLFDSYYNSLSPEYKANNPYLNNYLSNPFYGDDIYLVRWGVSEDLQYSLSGSSYAFVPKSVVQSVIDVPFSSVDDYREFKRRYLMYEINLANRPVNFVITLGDLLKGKFDDMQPATKELVADLPFINGSSLPLENTGTLPAPSDVNKEKEKESKDWNVAPLDDLIDNTGENTGDNTSQQDKDKDKDKSISLDFDFSKLKELLDELFKKLFVPSDTFFEREITAMKNSLENKIDTKYIDKIFDIFKNVGVYDFPDIYIVLDGKSVKVFDFSFVRNNLPSIKAFTDPLFWLLLMLFIYNETYFLIRGVYPLNLRRSEKNDN